VQFFKNFAIILVTTILATSMKTVYSDQMFFLPLRAPWTSGPWD